MNRPKETIGRKRRTWRERLFKFNTKNASGSDFIFYVLYVAFFGIIYIANTHYAERNVRKINKMQAEVEELRIDYTTLKAQYMQSGKRSEVIKRAAVMGIIESDKPATKITTKKE